MNPLKLLRIHQGYSNRSLTLIELTMSICIFALIVVGMSSIDTFSRGQVVTYDKIAKLQNDASYVLEHMAMNIMGTASPTTGLTLQGGAIGDTTSSSNNPVSLITVEGNNAIVINIDYNNNGKWDGTSTDRQIAYSYSGSPNYQIWYYAPYSGGTPGSHIALTPSRIRGIFTTDSAYHTYRTYSSNDNYIEVQIGTCWTPSSDTTCATPNNPGYDLKNRIYMPAASTH